MKDKLLVIACGAISHELVAIRKLNRWNHIEFQCLPPELHNSPERLPEAVKAIIEARRQSFKSLFVAYADCGTGGALDSMLDNYGIQRLPGAHCYEFFAGNEQFQAIAESEPGTFYLTDFLVRHFDRLVIKGLGLDRSPQLLPMYFGNYKRVVYLAQLESEELRSLAEAHASFLDLEFDYHRTGYTPLSQTLMPALKHENTIADI